MNTLVFVALCAAYYLTPDYGIRWLLKGQSHCIVVAQNGRPARPQ